MSSCALGLVACLALTPHVGVAQTAIIEGRVTLAPAGRAAAAADVRIEGTALTTVTDTAGRSPHPRSIPMPSLVIAPQPPAAYR